MQCKWRGIIIRSLYLFITLSIDCPFIPQGLDLSNTAKFRDWVSMDPKDYPGFSFHNGLKLFLWIVYQHYNLEIPHM